MGLKRDFLVGVAGSLAATGLLKVGELGIEPFQSLWAKGVDNVGVPTLILCTVMGSAMLWFVLSNNARHVREYLGYRKLLPRRALRQYPWAFLLNGIGFLLGLYWLSYPYL